MNVAALEPISVACPRCQQTVDQRFYGPCAGCIAELHTKFPGEARTIEHEDYVPTMNVTPNAVATKE